MNNVKQWKTLIIDGPFIAHRAYGASYKLTTSTGLDSTLMYGFLQSFRAVKNKFNPDHIMIAWETKHPGCWRSDIYPSYKQNRPKHHMKEYFAYQEDTQLAMHLLGITQYMSHNSEADDVIARLVEGAPKPVVIYANDKDMMQLVQDGVYVWTGKELFDEEKVKEKYGVEPYQIPDFLALAGDSSDNIAGIKNYGPQKTRQFLKKYGTIENIPLDDTFQKHMMRLQLFKQLTTLKKDCMLIPLYEENESYTETLTSLLHKYELKSVLENINTYKNIPAGNLDRWLS